MAMTMTVQKIKTTMIVATMMVTTTMVAMMMMIKKATVVGRRASHGTMSTNTLKGPCALRWHSDDWTPSATSPRALLQEKAARLI